jgi:hypothetical protein
MTLPGNLAHAPATLGFDTDSVVSLSAATAMVAQGYKFCARYLNRTKQFDQLPTSGALSVSEAQALLAAGLALTPVQFGDHALVPSAGLGTSVGEAAAYNAAGLGFPPGVVIWCDIEFSAKPTSSQATIAYINAWAQAVAEQKYLPGLYVGPNIPLTSDELHALPQIASYWKAASAVPWVSVRGFQIIQGLSFEVAGLNIDADMACYDNRNDCFQLLAPWR